MGSELRVSGSLRPTAVSCETVDRYIIAVRRCYRSIAACRFDALCFFGLMCGTAVLLIVLSACGFYICGFVRCFWFCFICVWTDSFVSLYVSEFLTAACGVSLLRERPALAQAPRGLPKGLTPTLFSLGAGLLVLCASFAYLLFIYLLIYGFIFLHLTKMK